MIKGIDLRTIQNNKIYFDKDNQPLNFLDNINKLNIFVGANNSGKSRFLRRILSNPDCHLYSDELTQRIIDEDIKHLDLINKKLSQDYQWKLPSDFKNPSNMDIVSYTMYLYNTIVLMNDNENIELNRFKDILVQVMQKK